MTCPNCQSENMIESKVGWLCLNCGEVQKKTTATKKTSATKSVPAVATTPELIAPEPKVDPAATTAEVSLASIASLDKPPAASKPKKSSLHHYWVAVVVVILLLVGLAAAYTLPGYFAKKSLEHKLVGVQTAKYSGTLEFYGQDFLSAYNSKLNFNGVFDRSDGPIAAAINFDGVWAKQSYTGQAIVRDRNLYFRLAGNHLPVIRYKQSAALLPLESQWYRAPINQQLFNNVCENRGPAANPQPLALYSLVKTAKVQRNYLTFPWARVNGGCVTVISGTISNRNFSDIITNLAGMLPAGCDLNTLGFTPSDAKNLHLSYRLWTSPGLDRLVLTLTDKALDSRLVLHLDASGYNQPQGIVPPEKAADLNALEAKLAK